MESWELSADAPIWHIALSPLRNIIGSATRERRRLRCPCFLVSATGLAPSSMTLICCNKPLHEREKWKRYEQSCANSSAFPPTEPVSSDSGKKVNELSNEGDG